MNTDSKSHRPRPVLHSLFSFVFLVALFFAAFVFDHSLVEQIRDFIKGGHWPTFVASTRLVAYLITTLVASKLAHNHKYPTWLICSASAAVFILAALWL